MDQNWKKFLKWQWSEIKKYFDLTDPTRRSPPLLVKVVGVFFLLVLLLWIIL
jgi:hypothetical protein